MERWTKADTRAKASKGEPSGASKAVMNRKDALGWGRGWGKEPGQSIDMRQVKNERSEARQETSRP